MVAAYIYFHVVILFCLCAGEIDRCLKKVSEGVEQFEDIWKKVSISFLFCSFTNGLLYYLSSAAKIIREGMMCYLMNKT